VSRASKQATLREQADLQAEAKARVASGSGAPPPAADGGDLEPEAPPAAVIEPTEDAPLDAARRRDAAARRRYVVEDPRDAIYGRAREVRDKEIAEHAADPEVQQLDRFSGGQPAATPMHNPT
jgi:hypothetical protein